MPASCLCLCLPRACGTSQAAAWALFNEFDAELGAITGEVWISLRERLHVVEEFMRLWARTVCRKHTIVPSTHNTS